MRKGENKKSRVRGLKKMCFTFICINAFDIDIDIQKSPYSPFSPFPLPFPFFRDMRQKKLGRCENNVIIRD